MLSRIEQSYHDYYNELITSGKKPLKETKVGLWGQFPCNVYENFFRQIRLDKYKSFIDLGSGDGKVVLIASLFTKAYGIEYDKELYHKSIEIKKDLGLDCKIYNEDYFNINISNFHLVFINPDKGFHNRIEEKIIKELKGDFFVCNQIFLPRFMKRNRTYWSHGVPITNYTKD